MKFWKYGRVALALIGSIILGLNITCCGIYTSGYLFATGVQFNQVAAYKIDHDFGYLTPVTGSPFPANGFDPVQELVVPGGRFLAVVNKGQAGVAGSGGVSIFTIGGAGVLYFQGTYSTAGSSPVSIAMDASSRYMYVTDQIAPDGSGRGDITVFQFDSNTGKLTLITNANTFNTNGKQLSYFEVNYKPVQVVVAAGYVYVLDQGYPTGTTGVPGISPSQQYIPDVFLYQINETSGQLVLTQNQPLQTGSKPGALSTMAVSGGGKYLYLADTAANEILPFTIGSGGTLQTLVGGPVPNYSTSVNPDAILPSANTNFLYVANFGPGSVQAQQSNITAYTVDQSNGQLQQIPGNPYPSGPGPIWMVEDPTNQYIYEANFYDNTINGYIIDASTGQLSPLFKGTSFATVGQPTFIAVSSRVY